MDADLDVLVSKFQMSFVHVKYRWYDVACEIGMMLVFFVDVMRYNTVGLRLQSDILCMILS